MKKLLFLMTLLFAVGCTNANHKMGDKHHHGHHGKLHHEDVTYEQDGKQFLGYMVSDSKEMDKPKPAVLVIHPWEGMDDFTRREADKYARAGFIVFAMDMYGVDEKIESPKDAGRVAGSYRNNRPLMRSRVEKALEVLKANKGVDVNNIGVVGYCFGGDAAIDYMLYKKAFKAGVSIHGFYRSPLNEISTLNGALEIHHGEADANSTMEEFNNFIALHPETETFLYKDAGHAYTVPTSSNFNPEDAKLTIKRTIDFLNKNLK